MGIATVFEQTMMIIMRRLRRSKRRTRKRRRRKRSRTRRRRRRERRYKVLEGSYSAWILYYRGIMRFELRVAA